MSIPGTFVQAALNEHSTFALNPEVAETLHARVLQWEEVVHQYLDSLLGLTRGEHVGWWVVNWFQTWVRYVPDKTMSAAIALVVLKYGYPLFERELIHGGPDGERPRDDDEKEKSEREGGRARTLAGHVGRNTEGMVGASVARSTPYMRRPLSAVKRGNANELVTAAPATSSSERCRNAIESRLLIGGSTYGLFGPITEQRYTSVVGASRI